MRVKRTVTRNQGRPNEPSEPITVTQTIAFKATEGGYSESEIRDGTLDAFMRRLDAHQELLVDLGKFSKDDATLALASPSPAAKELPAKWLREELAKLREGERTPGKSPARRHLTLSRIVIADLAMTMVEACDSTLGENLVCLLQELLDVDRHRRTLKERRPSSFDHAAAIEGQYLAQGLKIGVRRLAKIVHVQPSTITIWRADLDYQSLVETWRGMALKPWFKKQNRKLAPIS